MAAPSRTSPPGALGALLFAAGHGTRLRPLTEVLAKPALPVLDVPLGSWGLAALARVASMVVANVSHLPRTVERALGTRPQPFELFLEEPEALGTGGTLWALRKRVGERLLTWNADAVCDVDLEVLVHQHEAGGTAATLAVSAVGGRADFEVRDGKVSRLVDRRREDVPGFRFIGIAVYERDALDLVGEDVPIGATESVLRPLIEEGALSAHLHPGYALDVGTIERYLTVSLDLLEGLAPAVDPGPPGEIIEIEGGRAYVGPGADVGQADLGPGAIVLSGARLEGARIERAIVWPDEIVPSGTELRDCVWFRGTAFRAGAS